MDGRRVENTGALQSPGDYAVDYVEGTKEIEVVWFVMPTGMWGRCPTPGHGGQKANGDPEPEWDASEDGDGRVTIEPSIHCVNHWHGFLKAGVWSDA